jgi:hypothetical protein
MLESSGGVIMTMGDTFGPAERRPQLRGVSGWLLFLCISLMILLPVRVGLFLWAILSTPGALGRFSAAVLMPVLVLPLLGIVGGVLLYREHVLGVRLVQAFFGLQVLLGVIALIGGAAGALLFLLPSAAWLAYLFRSERVRNTYFKETTRDAAEVFR